MIRGILLLLCFGYGLVSCWHDRAVRQPDGVLITEEPVQKSIKQPEPFEHRGHQLMPVAEWSMKARILSTERYRWDRGALISPLDFAVGWGDMSNNEVLAHVTIKQSGRFARYRWDAESPLNSTQINQQMANIHLIPANQKIAKQLQSVRSGHIVRIHGRLVNVEGDRFTWRSSLTRTDTGDGACELLYVEAIEVVF